DKPAEQALGTALTILYFHGNAGNLTNRIENIAFLRQLPANVLAVDYRGYGKSEGRPTEAGVYLDAQAAYDYLFHERGVVPDHLVVLGQSLGVAVAVDLASKRPVAGLILEGGFPSAGRVVQRSMGLPGLRFVIRSKFDSAAKLKEISVPVLVAHCTRDPILPYALGEELYAAANQPKTFVSYDSDYHEPLFFADPSDYAARLRAFLESATEAQRPRD
ncbi:MAG: alpha/beta hydrolase, partial [Candidatus Acidiferrales bacterium]